MKRTLTFLLCYILLSNFGFAQSEDDLRTRAQFHTENGASSVRDAGSALTVVITDSSSLAQMISATIFGGCVQISNITWSGNVNAFGVFSDTGEVSGMDQGLVMSTGSATLLPSAASYFSSAGWGISGDSTLSELAATATMDAAILEFDFIPVADTIFATDFVFGSEEYPEWVNAGFNDVFAFFISGGPDELPETNLALVPSTTDPVTINTINENVNAAYYIDNSTNEHIVFDGLTTLIPLSYPVVAGETYHFRIAIADGGDASYDSGILIRAQSFCGSYWLQSSEFIMEPQGGTTYLFNNQSDYSTEYYWDFGDGTTSTEISPTHTYAQTGNYTVSLSAFNLCQDVASEQQLNMTVTGFEENANTKLDVYPLPDRTLMIDYSASTSAQLGYEIIDGMGRIVDSNNIGISDRLKREFPTAVRSSGVYFVRFRMNNRTIVKKVVW